jgi:hypothetical protein
MDMAAAVLERQVRVGYDPKEVAEAKAFIARDLTTKLKPMYLEKLEPEKPSFRHEVGGIIPGYKGHMPRAREMVGKPTHGFTGYYDSSPEKRPYGQFSGAAPKAQSFAHSPTKPTDTKLNHGPEQKMGVLPGYSGHISKKREMYARTSTAPTSQTFPIRLTSRPVCASRSAPPPHSTHQNCNRFGASIYSKK